MPAQQSSGNVFLDAEGCTLNAAAYSGGQKGKPPDLGGFLQDCEIS